MLETAVALRLRDRFTGLVIGRPEHVVRGLASLRRWQELARLCSGPWFADLVRAPTRGRWALERRLILLGMPIIAVEEARNAPVGTAVRVEGVVRSLPSATRPATSPSSAWRPAHTRSLSHIGNVWKNSTSRTADVCHLIDEGQDFLLEAPNGGLRVAGQGGQLVRGEQLGDGDLVLVLGFVDRMVDPSHGAGPRGPSLRPVIRSGDQLPLLLWKVEQ